MSIRISDPSDFSTQANVFSLSDANGLAVAILDGSGNQITSFGGGTQYTDGSAEATPTGTVAMGFDGTDVWALRLDSSTHYLQVDLKTAIPAGSNLIGQIEVSDGTNVLFTSSHPGYIQGTVTSTNAAIGATGSAVPSDAIYIGADKSGDLTGLQLDSNSYLYVNAANLNVDVNGFLENDIKAVNGNTFSGSELPVALYDGSGNAIASASGSLKVTLVGTGANSTPILVTQTPASDVGWSTDYQSALGNTAHTVKSGAGTLGGYAITNPNASTIEYVMFFNKTSPTIGTDTPLWVIGIPGGGAAHIEFVNGIAFSTDIVVIASSSVASSTNPSTGLVVTTLYK